ncbi:MAG TPA: arsenate reductase ArsC [Candidatus Binatia bacterium]|nr:arsenate reductase ArsC [Candidatus Binatia bacterium]
MTDAQPRRVLFVCTHNSARSQMAEGMLRAWGEDRFEAHSAGTEVSAVRPEAVTAMAEIGIDIGGHRSKSVEHYLGQKFEWVITVCDQARQNCPVFPGVEHTGHWSVEDPSEATGSEEQRLETFRRVRDDLRNRIHVFILAASREDLPAPEVSLVNE